MTELAHPIKNSKWKIEPTKLISTPIRPGTTPLKSGKEKPIWIDPVTKCSFSAGGILIYDDEGFYLVGEESKGGVSYSDLGGKFNPEDGSIWTTIRRELHEESYGIVDVYVDEIKELTKKGVLVSVEPIGSSLHGKLLKEATQVVRSHSYLCLVVHAKHSHRLQTLIQQCIETDEYEKRRIEFLDRVVAPQKLYIPLHIRKVNYQDLNRIAKGHRLGPILSALLKTDHFKPLL